MHEKFIARQPIFDDQLKLFAYELLFRRAALTRAFFCEAVAKKLGAPLQSSDLFLMGLLSVTDAILDRPIQQILASLPISPEVRAALCGEVNSYRDVYELLLAYERADWAALAATSTRLNLAEPVLLECEAKAREAASIC
jgi:c-di-GMP-related signal transduction protein